MKIPTMGAAEERRADTGGASFCRTLMTILVLALIWADLLPAAQEFPSGLPGYHVRGRASILEAMRAVFSDPNYRITWTPKRARLADGGDVGFTTGSYVTTRSRGGGGVDQVEGRYVTFWKREDGGPWIVWVDIGLPGPATDRPN